MSEPPPASFLSTVAVDGDIHCRPNQRNEQWPVQSRWSTRYGPDSVEILPLARALRSDSFIQICRSDQPALFTSNGVFSAFLPTASFSQRAHQQRTASLPCLRNCLFACLFLGAVGQRLGTIAAHVSKRAYLWHRRLIFEVRDAALHCEFAPSTSQIRPLLGYHPTIYPCETISSHRPFPSSKACRNSSRRWNIP